MNNPKVSVILPAFNAEKYLKSSILSILKQSYKNLELIIINDGSKDRTEEIILQFDDARIKYLKNETNLGLIKSLNKAIDLSEGKYVARMDADDVAHYHRIEKQVGFLEKLKSPAAVGSNVIIIGSNDQVIKVPRKMNSKEAENSWVKFRKNPIHHPTVMLSREIISAYNPFYHSEDLHVEDYAAWLRINKSFPIYNIISPLLFYRMHDTNITKSFSSSQNENLLNLLHEAHLNDIGKVLKRETLKSWVYLKLFDGLDAHDIYQEITAFGEYYSQKNNQGQFIKNDLAYSIINIGLKSGANKFLHSLYFVTKRMGICPLVYALRLTLSEAMRSIFCLYFYQYLYSKHKKRLENN